MKFGSRLIRLVYIISIILVVIVIFQVQFSQPDIIGADGQLHARMSEMILQTGLLRNFPQAHFSWFNFRFSDKDFIYHLLLIPFIFSTGLTLGTKIAAFLLTLLLFYLVLVVSKKNSGYAGAILSMSVLLLSAQFMRDMAEARPFVVAIALTVIGIHLVINQKSNILGIICLLYGMTHLSAWIIPVFAVIYEIYIWINEGKYNTKLVFLSWGGYLFSFLLHPNFPNNIWFMYLNGILVPWYALQGGVLELGAEFFPLSTKDILIRYPMFIGSALMIFSAFLIFPEKIRKSTVGWAIASLFLGLMALISTRNLTHFYPIYTIFIVSFAGDIFHKIDHTRTVSIDRFLSIFIPLFGIIVLGSAWMTISFLKQMLFDESLYTMHFINMSTVIRSKIPPGSRIFHSNWSDSQYLIGFAPNYEYFVTFDPIYMFTYNKQLYDEYRQISFGNSIDPYIGLTRDFDTYYGYVGKNYFQGLINQIRADNRFSILAEDDLGLLFKVNNK